MKRFGWIDFYLGISRLGEAQLSSSVLVSTQTLNEEVESRKLTESRGLDLEVK